MIGGNRHRVYVNYGCMHTQTRIHMHIPLSQIMISEMRGHYYVMIDALAEEVDSSGTRKEGLYDDLHSHVEGEDPQQVTCLCVYVCMYVFVARQ
jgi:hypothetical protein